MRTDSVEPDYSLLAIFHPPIFLMLLLLRLLDYYISLLSDLPSYYGKVITRLWVVMPCSITPSPHFYSLLWSSRAKQPKVEHTTLPWQNIKLRSRMKRWFNNHRTEMASGIRGRMVVRENQLEVATSVLTDTRHNLRNGGLYLKQKERINISSPVNKTPPVQGMPNCLPFKYIVHFSIDSILSYLSSFPIPGEPALNLD